MVSESNTNDTKIILKDGVEFVWKKVQGASNYLLRLLENKLLKENSLLGCATSTSVEIPYSSLPFKSATEKSKKRPLEVVIEVWAYGNTEIIGDGIRYTNVGMYESYTNLSSKRKISSLFYRGKNLLVTYLTCVTISLDYTETALPNWGGLILSIRLANGRVEIRH